MLQIYCAVFGCLKPSVCGAVAVVDEGVTAAAAARAAAGTAAGIGRLKRLTAASSSCSAAAVTVSDCRAGRGPACAAEEMK